MLTDHLDSSLDIMRCYREWMDSPRAVEILNANLNEVGETRTHQLLPCSLVLEVTSMHTSEVTSYNIVSEMGDGPGDLMRAFGAREIINKYISYNGLVILDYTKDFRGLTD